MIRVLTGSARKSEILAQLAAGSHYEEDKVLIINNQGSINSFNSRSFCMLDVDFDSIDMLRETLDKIKDETDYRDIYVYFNFQEESANAVVGMLKEFDGFFHVTFTVQSSVRSAGQFILEEIL